MNTSVKKIYDNIGFLTWFYLIFHDFVTTITSKIIVVLKSRQVISNTTHVGFVYKATK